VNFSQAHHYARCNESKSIKSTGLSECHSADDQLLNERSVLKLLDRKIIFGVQEVFSVNRCDLLVDDSQTGCASSRPLVRRKSVPSFSFQLNPFTMSRSMRQAGHGHLVANCRRDAGNMEKVVTSIRMIQRLVLVSTVHQVRFPLD